MRDDLAARAGPVLWTDLEAHVARDAVIVIDRSLGLVDVGVAMAADDEARVAAWVDAGLVRKWSAEEIARFRTETEARWDALVIAPFVLVRERDPEA